MRLRFAAALVFGALAACFDSAAAKPDVERLYLLNIEQRHAWCAFRDEKSWGRAVDASGAMEIARATYVDGRLRKLYLSTTDETGDWMVYDYYSINSRGEISRLTRITNVLPGDRSVTSTYRVRNGAMRLTAKKAVSLSTLQPLGAPSPVWTPDLPVSRQLSDFPFYSLLGRPDLEGSAKRCTSKASAAVR